MRILSSFCLLERFCGFLENFGRIWWKLSGNVSFGIADKSLYGYGCHCKQSRVSFSLVCFRVPWVGNLWGVFKVFGLKGCFGVLHANSNRQIFLPLPIIFHSYRCCNKQSWILCFLVGHLVLLLWVFQVFLLFKDFDSDSTHIFYWVETFGLLFLVKWFKPVGMELHEFEWRDFLRFGVIFAF